MKKDPLKEYYKKRHFSTTPEPQGNLKRPPKNTKLSFVIHEHHARRLHYDLRLEWNGVLKSWAVPKGPSEDPSDKRLAVQTEDHPIEYGKFSGTIPEGEYGAGEVLIWDKGIWVPETDPEDGFKKGHLEFTLKGKKLHGRWHLIKTHYREGEGKTNWLLVKGHDQKKSQKVTKDPWPGFISPQFPKLVSTVPCTNGWIYEMKYDGYRIQAHLKNKLAHLYTRRCLDWSNSFPHILESVAKISAHDAIFDGEIVALDHEGHSHFQRLQNSLTLKRDQHLLFYVFDLLYLNGKDLRALPLVNRKEILKKILDQSPENIIYSEHLTEEGESFYKLSCEHQLEGIVAKSGESSYRSGRNDAWVKIKCGLRQEFVIGGFTNPKGTRAGFGALLLGVYENEKLKYVGKVGTGFNDQSLRELKKVFSKLERKTSPFEVRPPQETGIHWLKPIKIAEVRFSNWTDEGLLRTPTFIGMREDKPAEDIHMELSETKEVSSPDKILFKKERITKKDVSKFYQEIGVLMLPYLKDRPLSLVRCPEGTGGACFFQKHISGNIPKAFQTFPISDEKGEGIYISINTTQGLQELVQLNAFELHAWNCHRQSIMRPDQIVFDLDPGPGVPWREVARAAIELRDLLEDLNLKSFVKLTGGKGLHVHVPIAPLYDWNQVKDFSHVIALKMVKNNPIKYTATMSKKLRGGKIFIDYLRNSFGATAVVPYSLRAKSLSTVALPVAWNELNKMNNPHISLNKALVKIRRRKSDPWAGMFKLKQKIEILRQLAKLSQVA